MGDNFCLKTKISLIIRVAREIMEKNAPKMGSGFLFTRDTVDSFPWCQRLLECKWFHLIFFSPFKYWNNSSSYSMGALSASRSILIWATPTKVVSQPSSVLALFWLPWHRNVAMFIFEALFNLLNAGVVLFGRRGKGRKPLSLCFEIPNEMLTGRRSSPSFIKQEPNSWENYFGSF